jgi:putative membrane protein
MPLRVPNFFWPFRGLAAASTGTDRGFFPVESQRRSLDMAGRIDDPRGKRSKDSMTHISRFVATIALSAVALHCGRENEAPAASPEPAMVEGSATDMSNTSTPASPSAPANDESRLEPASRTEAATASTAPAPAKLSDAEIAAISDAANAAEVEQAQAAKGKAKHPRVKKFAQMMIDHHGQARKEQTKLLGKLQLTPAESPALADLRSASATTLSTLQAAPKADFDQVYMDSQIEGHRKVLETFDTQLLPNAQDPELKKLLEGLRPRIEAHLKEATEIRQMLDTTSENKAGAKTTTPTSSNATNSPTTSPATGSGKSGTTGTTGGSPKP